MATSEDPETAQSAVVEPVMVRLSHQQRVQLKARVETSHWSRSTQILRSDWLGS